MSRVVIHHNMNIKVWRNSYIDSVKELAELNRAMMLVAFSQDFTGLGIESCKKRCSSMPRIVMSPSFHLSRTHRKQGLHTVKGLNLGLLIHTKNQSLVRWAHIKPNNIPNLVDKKRVSRELETQGLVLSEDYSSWLALAEAVSHRIGMGDAMAEGWFALSKKIGVDLTKLVSVVKGTFCYYDARSTKIDPRSFSMVVNPRGSHHAQGHWITSMHPSIDVVKAKAPNLGIAKEDADRIFVDAERLNTARLTKHVLDAGMLIDCLGSCTCNLMLGVPVNVKNLAELYSAATGIEMSPAELKTAGERAYNMLKLLNVREGFSRRDDAFPELWFKPRKTPDGIEVLTDYYGTNSPVTREDTEKMLDDYYDERGWDIAGIPTRRKLMELGLGEFAPYSSHKTCP